VTRRVGTGWQAGGAPGGVWHHVWVPVAWGGDYDRLPLGTFPAPGAPGGPWSDGAGLSIPVRVPPPRGWDTLYPPPARPPPGGPRDAGAWSAGGVRGDSTGGAPSGGHDAEFGDAGLGGFEPLPGREAGLHGLPSGAEGVRERWVRARGRGGRGGRGRGGWGPRDEDGWR